MLWVKLNGEWKRTERRAGSGASAIEGLCLARDEWGGTHLGPGTSLSAGGDVTEQELESVWGKRK